MGGTQASAAGSPLMIDREMAMRMVTIRTMGVYKVNLIASTPRPSSCENEDEVDIPEPDEDGKFPINPDDVRPTYVELQRVIESARKIFEENLGTPFIYYTRKQSRQIT